MQTNAIVRVFHGDEATKQLGICLNSASQDDATGGVLIIHWVASGMETLPKHPADVAEDLEKVLQSSTLNMVIVDSGNISGDSWKFIYYHEAQMATFLDERTAIDNRTA